MKIVPDFSRFKSFLDTDKNIHSDVDLMRENKGIAGRYVRLVTIKNSKGALEVHCEKLNMFDSALEFCKRLFLCKSENVYRKDSCLNVLSQRIQESVRVQKGHVSEKMSKTMQAVLSRDAFPEFFKGVYEIFTKFDETHEKKRKADEVDGDFVIKNGNNYSLYDLDRNDKKIPYANEIWKKSLLTFRQLDRTDAKKLIELYEKEGVKTNIDEIDNFYEKLDQMDEGILSSISMLDLLSKGGQSRLNFALLSNKEFEKLTVSDLAKMSLSDAVVISARMKLIKNPSMESTPESKEILDVSVSELSHLSPEYINKNIADIPPVILFLASDSQVSRLDLENISAAQIKALVSTNDPVKNKERFERLSTEKATSVALEDPSLTCLFSDKQIQGVDAAKLKKEHLHELFPTKYDMQEESKRRFALLSKEQVGEIIDKVDGETRFSFLSDDQIKELDVTKLKKVQLQDLFPTRYDMQDESKRRFALLSNEQVGKIIDKLEGETRFSFLTDDHIKELDVTKLEKTQLQDLFPSRYDMQDESKRRFALLSKEQVGKIIDKIEGETRLSFLSNDQIKGLDVTKLEKAQLQDLFPSRYDMQDESKRRFALLSKKQVGAIIDKVEGETRLSFLSEDQIKELDVTKLKKDQVQELFPSRYDMHGESKRRFALLSKEQVKHIVDKLDGEFRLGLLSEDHIKELDVTKLEKSQLQDLFPTRYDMKEESKRRFAQLSKEQVNSIIDEVEVDLIQLISPEQLNEIPVLQFNKIKGSLSRETLESLISLRKI